MRLKRMLGAIVFLLIAATPARAQMEVVADTTCFRPPATMATENGVDDWVLFAFVVALPPTLLAFVEDCDRYAPLDAVRDGVSAEAGASAFWIDSGKGAVGTAKASAILGGVYLEAGFDRFVSPDVQLRTYRAGYLLRPVRRAAGGLVVGYGDASGAAEEWRLAGFELGFPMIVSLTEEGATTAWMRYETRYVFTDDGGGIRGDIAVWLEHGRLPIRIGLTGFALFRDEGPAGIGLSIGSRLGPMD